MRFGEEKFTIRYREYGEGDAMCQKAGNGREGRWHNVLGLCSGGSNSYLWELLIHTEPFRAIC